MDRGKELDARRLLIDLARTSKGRTEIWIEFIRRTGTKTCAEIGVWKGAFAAQVLKACPAVDHYTMVDPWRRLDDWNKPKNLDEGLLREAKATALQVTEFASHRRTVLQGTTLEIVDRIDDSSLDFIYVDGDHTLRGITIDLVALWPKVRPGGILAGDDLSRTVWQHGPEFEPTGVFPFAVYFAEAVRRPIVILPFEQFAILPGTEYRLIDTTGRYPDTTLLGALRLPFHKQANRMVQQQLRRWFGASGAT